MITKLEIKRQAIHITLGILIITLFYYDIINYIILGIITIIGFLLSYLTKKGHKIPVYTFLLDRLERDSEKAHLRAKGMLFYLLGSSLAMLFFSKEIALASIAILAIGDSTSRLIGPYGYIKHPFNSKKFIEGIIVGGILATVAGYIFVPFYLALSASAVSMFIESLDIEINNFKIDDNLTIPLAAGAVMLLITSFLI